MIPGSQLEQTHHLQNLENHEKEENEDCPDEVLRGGFDGFAGHGACAFNTRFPLDTQS